MERLTNTAVIEGLVAQFGQKIFDQTEPHGLLTVEVEAASIIDVLRYLKESLGFNFLTDITGIHYPERSLPLGVIYHLHSFRNNLRIRLKAFLEDANPSISTATVLWEGANWMERETYDFFGINFDGHPDLRRILNVDDMTAFPMRKEFPLEDPNRADKKDFYFGR